jgi:hypothetical protein
VAPPGYPPEPDKKKGKSLRMFTHLWDAEGYVYHYPRAAVEIVAWLRRPPSGLWFAAVATSGQKHVLPHTPLNPPGGRMIRMEEETLPLGDWRLLEEIAELLQFFRREQIDAGAYPPLLLAKHAAIDLVRSFETRWAQFRGSAWWRFCIMMAKRPEGNTEK